MTNFTKQSFIVTKEHRRFVEFCDACQRYRYIGLCYGPPGVGKTLSAREYTKWDIVDSFNHQHFETHIPFDPDIINCKSIFYTPSITNSPSQIERGIYKIIDSLISLKIELDNSFLENENIYESEIINLIIIDEADRLKMNSLEQLRDIYDSKNIGLILIGMPGIEKRLSRYPQLYSRVGFVHQFKTLSKKEIEFIIEKKWQELGIEIKLDDFTDTEAINYIIQVTRGNFRLLHRLFTQIERVLKINELQTITKEVVETARDNLVIGQV